MTTGGTPGRPEVLSPSDRPLRAPRMRALRAALLLLGLIAPQVILYTSSLLGDTLLLPLELLAQDRFYLSQPAESRPFPAQNPMLSDQVLQFEPFRRFVVDELRQGRLPLWNPYNYCGSPFLAVNHPAVFSPLRMPGHLVASPVILAWLVLLKALVGGVGAYLFFRKALDVGYWPAAIGAWAYPLTGYLVLWSAFVMSDAALWLPWMLLAVDGLVRRPAGFGAPGLALSSAGSLLSGHIAVTAHVLLASGLYLLWRLPLRRDPRRAGAAVAAALAGWVLGLMLSAPQNLPTAEYMQRSNRVAERAVSGADFTPVGWPALPQLVLPYFHGATEANGIRLVVANRMESSAAGYAGLILALVAAPLAACSRRHRLAAAFWAAMSLLGSAQVLGIPGLVRIFDVFPLALLQNNRFTFLTGFGVVVLAVIGLQALACGEVKRRRWFALPVIALLLLGAWSAARVLLPPEPLASRLAALVANPETAAQLPVAVRDLAGVEAARLRFASLSAVGAGFCALAVALWAGIAIRPRRRVAILAALTVAALGELLWAAYGVNPQSHPSIYYPRIPALDQLAQGPPGRICGDFCLPPNLNLTHHLKDVRGYDAADPKPLMDLFALALGPPAANTPRYARLQWIDPKPSPILRMLNLRYVVHRGRAPAEASPVARSPGYWVEERPALGRAYVPLHALAVPSDAEVLALLGRPDFDPAEQAYVRASQLALGPEAMRGTATVVDEIPTRVTLALEMQTPGVVVLSDLWFPGWRADLDGREVDILRVNHALRGVIVPEGSARLTFRYEPASFAWGVRIMLLAAILVTLWMVLAARSGARASRGSMGSRGPTHSPGPIR